VHWTGAWFDNADGRRPGPALALQIISDTAPADAWATWPGMWGGTQPPPGDSNPLDDSSPRGPGGHPQYRQPDALLQTAVAHKASLAPAPLAAAPPPPPTVTATTAGNDLHITFDTHITNPAGLVVTVGDPHQPAPPAIHRVPVTTDRGTIVIPGAAVDQQSIHVSVAADDGGASPATMTEPS
jgi:hypothetical protein